MTTRTDVRQFSRRFRAMGTDVDVWLWNGHEGRARNALDLVQRFFTRTEARLSRFRADSELARLNRAAGTSFNASPLLFELVDLALTWRGQTGGIFDPAVLPALMAYGYDRSFTQLVVDGPLAPATVAQLSAPVDSTGIVLGPGRSIYLPPGVALDLGGIAKGWTAQQAVYRLGMWGPSMVDAGGDIACTGAPAGEPWVVTVADPHNDRQDLAILDLRDAAIATSSRVRRQWIHAGKPAHHLIDPRCGAPALTNVLSATVIAPRLPDAEIHAKTALILGEEQGAAYLTVLPNVSACLVLDDGRRLMCGKFEERAYVPSSNNFAARFQVPTPGA